MNRFDLINPMTGDVLVCATDGWFGRAIRFFGRAHTGSARVNHAAIVLRDGDEMLVWEAGPMGISTRPLSVYANTPLALYRHDGMYVEERQQRMFELCMKLVGQSYGFLKLPLYALDGIGGWVNRVVLRNNKPFYFFSKSFGITHFKVCSNAVGYVYEKTFGQKNFFHVPWRSLTPDLIDDYCISHADWSVVHDSL